MSFAEKKALGENIRVLPPEYLRGVWEIVSQSLPANQVKEELEFDIDSLPTKTCRTLERYVNQKLQLLQKTNPIRKNEANVNLKMTKDRP